MTNFPEKHTPDRWLVLELTVGTDTVRKVMGGWYGGYLGSDMWKLSSEIVSVDEYDDRFEFHNHSGSTYICYKQAYGASGLMGNMITYWEKKGATITPIEEYNKRKAYIPVDITLNGKLI